jgi:hypothetical protein
MARAAILVAVLLGAAGVASAQTFAVTGTLVTSTEASGLTSIGTAEQPGLALCRSSPAAQSTDPDAKITGTLSNVVVTGAKVVGSKGTAAAPSLGSVSLVSPTTGATSAGYQDQCRTLVPDACDALCGGITISNTGNPKK